MRRRDEGAADKGIPLHISLIKLFEAVQLCSVEYLEVVRSLKLGNVWAFVQLIFGPPCPMNQLNKNPNIA